MSLLFRFFVLVFLALVPMVAIQVDNEVQLRRNREEEVRQGALRLAALFEAEQERMVAGQGLALTTLAQAKVVREGDWEECQRLVERLRGAYPDFLQVHVADRSGSIRCATDHSAIGVIIADRSHFREALATGGIAVGEHIVRRASGLPALPVGLPYHGVDGNPAGVVTALTDIGWLTEHLRGKPLPPDTTLTLVDRAGTIIARVPEVPGMFGAALPDHYRELLSAAEPAVVELPGPDQTPAIVAVHPPAAGAPALGVLVSIDKGAVMRPVDDAMSRALGVIALVSALTLLTAWWGGNRFVRRPTAALVATARRWGQGDWSARTQLAGERSELGTLGQAFDRMAEELGRQAAVREETDAAAHKMATVLASVTDGVFELDRDGRIVFMNNRARLLIADGRDVIGRRLWDVYSGDAGDDFARHHRRAMAEQEPVEFESHHPFLDAWYAVRAFPLCDGLAVFLQDITARKRGEEALSAATREKGALLAQVNALLENAPVGFAFFDREQRWLRVNANLAELSGIPAEAHIGRTLADVRLGRAGRVGPLIDRVFATGKAVPHQEVVADEPDGAGVRRHWLASFFPVHGETEVTAVGAVVMDITDLRQAENARRVSDERFRSIVELAAVGIERVSFDGRFLDVNAKLCAILGYSREELLARGFRDLADPADQSGEEALIDALLAGEIASYAIEKRYRRKDGATVWVRVTSSLARITGTEEAYRISIVEDITERKAMEEELRAAKDAAERADLAKSRFLAAASHDLRQPLQSLFFFTAALADHVAQPLATDLLRRIERGLDALKELMDSLLDMSRLDAGVVTPALEDFSVAEILDPLLEGYAPLAAAKGLDLRVEGCARTVRSDRTLLSRLVRNLVENALRYTEEGLVRVHCRAEGGQLAIVVQDTGIGIPADHLERIFEEFHQVGNPERDRTQGLGLGLAIVRRLSRLLDHPVEVRSVHGKGSAFRVLIPLGAAAAEVPARAAGGLRDGAGGGPDGKGRFAVLVDDDAVVLMGLQITLQEWGYAVLTAGCADQAMERLAAQPRVPDIVITDYRLREGRVGTEVLRRVRGRYGAHIPGVILTGETGADCLLDAATHKVPVIHKPVTPRQLALALERQIEAVAA